MKESRDRRGLAQREATTVFIVDDSPTARALLRTILEADGSIRVVGEAAEGETAVVQIARVRPDVVLMDVVMPVQDGLETTRIVMSQNPRPILLVSDLVEVDAELNFRGLQAGALDIMGKPSVDLLDNEREAHRFRRRVRTLAGVPLVTRRHKAPVPRPVLESSPRVPSLFPEEIDLIVIGASTGGPPALHVLLRSIDPSAATPILLVQHMSERFIEGMVRWLDREVDREVRLAEEGTTPRPHTVYVAPDGGHMILRRSGVIGFDDAPPIGSHRPSVDALFHSIATHSICRRTIGVLLTGMGEDGANGLLEMKRGGAWTISQDQKSSVVYGMPKAARDLDASREILPLDQIGPRISQITTQASRSLR